MEVSSPQKLLYPADGVTKAHVVAHYERVATAMLGVSGRPPLLAGRPLTLQRFPNGITAKGFMQKNAAKYFPASIERCAVPKRGGGETLYPVVTQAHDVAYLANQNTVTFHMWTSSAARPGYPDWMVIDLDPEDGDLAGVRTATRNVADVLAEFDLEGFPVATGSKGFHVWLALDGSLHFNDVSRTARAIGGLAASRSPAVMTTEFLKKERKGRVFVDWLRNNPTATVVVPLSLRPRSGAPVAVPLRWDELNTVEPTSWKIDDLGDRVDVLAAALQREPQSLPTTQIIAAAEQAGVDLDTPHDRFGRRTTT